MLSAARHVLSLKVLDSLTKRTSCYCIKPCYFHPLFFPPCSTSPCLPLSWMLPCRSTPCFTPCCGSPYAGPCCVSPCCGPYSPCGVCGPSCGPCRGPCGPCCGPCRGPCGSCCGPCRGPCGPCWGPCSPCYRATCCCDPRYNNWLQTDKVCYPMKSCCELDPPIPIIKWAQKCWRNLPCDPDYYVLPKPKPRPKRFKCGCKVLCEEDPLLTKPKRQKFLTLRSISAQHVYFDDPFANKLL